MAESQEGDRKVGVMEATMEERTHDLRSPSGNTRHPDWYEDLNESQIQMFKEVFELLDRDGGGSLNTEEIYLAMKELDIDVSAAEIGAVLHELDNDGNGEIDFNEFLFSMTATDKYIDMLTEDPEKAKRVVAQGGYTKRQCLFFTAITKFAIKNTLGEIERYYANKVRQAPHVISFYAAGERLIGLNDKQLEEKWKEMQKASKNHASPYAKPLPFVQLKKRKPKSKSLKHGKAKSPPKVSPDTSPQKDDEQHEAMDSVEPIAQDSKNGQGSSKRATMRRQTAFTTDSEVAELLKILDVMAEQGSVLAKIPDVHLTPDVRSQLANAESRVHFRNYHRNTRPTLQEAKKFKPSGVLPNGCRTKEQPRGWVIPRIAHYVPMPVIPMTRHSTYTIEDVPEIRRVVSTTLDKYYSSLKQAHVRSAYAHWDRLHVNNIRSSTLRDNFRKVYRAYSPHKEEDVFVICPWIPGPRYTSRQPGKPMGNVGNKLDSAPKRPHTCPLPPSGGGHRSKASRGTTKQSHNRTANHSAPKQSSQPCNNTRPGSRTSMCSNQSRPTSRNGSRPNSVMA